MTQPEDPAAPRKRRFRRKCAYCGRWERDPKTMVLTPTGRVFHNDAHYAHQTCAEKIK